MYPAIFFGLFPPFPREKKVFVAMSFEEQFRSRWREVLQPAVRSIEVGGTVLEPYRVDVRRVSDSILTDILQGIQQHLIVLADVTTMGFVEHEGRRKPIRNANVLYEVGIAHAVRLPEEVILFRSDNDELIFDIANIRVNSYDPDDNPETARELVRNSIVEALREVELRKHLAVTRAVEALDFRSWWVLAEALNRGIEHPPTRTMRQALGNADRLRAISRLLDLGAIRAEYRQATPELLQSPTEESAETMVTYQGTEFGLHVLAECADRMNMFSPEIVSLLEERLQQEAGAPEEQ